MNIQTRIPKPLLIATVVVILGALGYYYVAYGPHSKDVSLADLSKPSPTEAKDKAALEPGKNVPAIVANPKDAGPAGNYLAARHADALGANARALDFFGAAVQDKTLATADLYSRMYVLGLTEGGLANALTALEKTEKLGGHPPLSKLARAVKAFGDKNYDAAIGYLSSDTSGLSRLLKGPLIAWAYVGKNDFPGALAALDTMKENPKVQAILLLHSALIHDVFGDGQIAGQKYMALQKFAGLSVRSAQLMGLNLERKGLSEQALALYKKEILGAESEIMVRAAKARIATQKAPDLDVDTAQKGAAEAIYGVSSILLAQNSWDSALALANLSLYLRPDFPAAAMVVAGAMEQSRRIIEANKIYKSIPETSPLSWTARLHLANNYDRLEQTPKALELLQTMGREQNDQDRPLIQLGDILRGHERFKDAITAYTEALDRISKNNALDRPQNWAVYYARGISYEQTKQWPKAEADFLKALTLQPDHPLVLNYLGYSWVDQGLHLDRALGMIRKAVNLRPRDGYIVDSLGWGLYRIGDYKGAVKHLQRATTLRAADPLITDHYGDALWQVGREREARFQWQRALNMENSADIKDKLIEKLKTGLVMPVSK